MVVMRTEDNIVCLVIGFALGGYVFGVLVGNTINNNWERAAVREGAGVFVLPNSEFHWKSEVSDEK